MPDTFLSRRLIRQKANSEYRRTVSLYDPNNLERVLNDLTSRFTSNASQRLATARALGINTSGLIIGGVRDTSAAPATVIATGGYSDPQTPTSGGNTNNTSGTNANDKQKDQKGAAIVKGGKGGTTPYRDPRLTSPGGL